MSKFIKKPKFCEQAVLRKMFHSKLLCQEPAGSREVSRRARCLLPWSWKLFLPDPAPEQKRGLASQANKTVMESCSRGVHGVSARSVPCRDAVQEQSSVPGCDQGVGAVLGCAPCSSVPGHFQLRLLLLENTA